MLIQRIFAGALTALMLSVFSLSAACDLSCAFPQGHSDCHSMRMESQQSGSENMAMPGMVMPGMTDAGSGNQGIAVAAQKTMPTHAVIGEMGPCARQSSGTFCEKKSFSHWAVRDDLHCRRIFRHRQVTTYFT
jgi:hypothetical protein